MVNNSEGLPNNFETDEPIRRKEDDLLDRTRFAGALASRIKSWSGSESLVLGLCGEWGCGKTSVKNLVVEQLGQAGESDPTIAEFNPWEFSGRQNVTSSFFETLAESLSNGDNQLGKGGAPLAEKFRKYSNYLLFTGNSVSVVSQALELLAPGASVIGKAASGAMNKAAFTLNAAAKAEDSRELESSSKTFSDLKGELFAEMLTLKAPVIFVIDDIDRLTQSEIREIVQLVKMNGDFPNIIYLLLFDRSIVAKALDEFSGGEGMRFMEKIVQVVFDIPKPANTAVSQALFDGISTILGIESTTQEWDRHRFTNLWQAGLKVFFSNMREVQRFLNSLRFHSDLMTNEATLEVNPIDIIALETIRVFEPTVYHELHSRRDQLVGSCGPNYITFDERGKRQEEGVASIVMLASQHRRSAVRAILSELFPFLMQRDYDENQSIREIRVNRPEFFDRYFTFSFSDGVSQHEVSNLIRTLGSPKEFRSQCKLLAQRGELKNAFDQMNAFFAVKYPVDGAAFARSLFHASDVFPSESKRSLTLGCNHTASVWIRFILKDRWDDSKSRLEVLLTAFDGEGVSLAAYVGSRETRREDADSSGFLLNDSDADIFISRVAESIKLTATSGELYKVPDFVYLLYRWKEWEEQEAIKGYLINYIESAKKAVRLLTLLLHVTHVSSENKSELHYSIDLQMVDDFFSSEKIDEITSEINLVNLDGDELRALRAFRFSMQEQRGVVYGERIEKKQLNEDV